MRVIIGVFGRFRLDAGGRWAGLGAAAALATAATARFLAPDPAGVRRRTLKAGRVEDYTIVGVETRFQQSCGVWIVCGVCDGKPGDLRLANRLHPFGLPVALAGRSAAIFVVRATAASLPKTVGTLPGQPRAPWNDVQSVLPKMEKLE